MTAAIARTWHGNCVFLCWDSVLFVLITASRQMYRTCISERQGGWPGGWQLLMPCISSFSLGRCRHVATETHAAPYVLIALAHCFGSKPRINSVFDVHLCNYNVDMQFSDNLLLQYSPST